MKHLRQFEKYDFNVEDGEEITVEYTKLIISTYLDSRDENKTLEYVYYDIIKSDGLDEDQEIMIKDELENYLENLYDEAKAIRTIEEIDEEKYNL